jgi:hypothetical protein
MFVRESERLIISDSDKDSAVILAHPGKLKLPDDVLTLLPSSASLPIGSEVGWLGFPALAPSTLCFFQGSVSARQEHAYLIDGVAINGVSGGPVFVWTDGVGVQIIGTVSAYFPNRATGDALPGLSIARDVSHFHDTIKRIHSLDEAIAKQQKQEQEKNAQSLAPPEKKNGS